MCVLTSSRSDDFSDIVTYLHTVMIRIFFGGGGGGVRGSWAKNHPVVVPV